jgi:hypothetical protein
LATSEYDFVLEEVATNLCTPPEVLAQLLPKGALMARLR